MSLKVRLALLVGLLLVVFLGALQGLRVMERARADQLRRESLAASELILKKWIDLTNQPLRRFARDFAEWPALLEFVARPDPEWADANLRANLPAYEAHALWVLDPSGRALYSAQTNPGPTLPVPADALAWGRGAGGSGASFFAESRDGLLEVWCVPVGSAASPRGFLTVARLWNNSHVAALSRLTETRTVLAPAEPEAAGGDAGAMVRIPFASPGGRPLRELVAQFRAPDFSQTLAQDTLSGYLFAAFGALLVIALWLAVRRWMLRPLDRISEALAVDSPEPIRPLLQERAEIGRIARLVESSFTQKSALEREIEQHKRTEAALRASEGQVRQSLELRARLARDLHDGVIQSIYAAGLGLESAMSQFEHDPAGARSRLQLCRQSLNDVIREVRAFINGIEPEDIHPRGFLQELEALARTMQALWPVHIRIHAAAANRLSPTQEVHALQISRECISNVRHGGATEIVIHLTNERGHALLRISDNGRGFDPSAIRGAGSGLGNLEARARELDGHLTVDSKPGAGANVSVLFPLEEQL